MTKKTLTVTTILLLVAFSLVAFVPVGQAAGVIAQQGDKNATVKEINTMLKALGYYYGTVTDQYGVSTKSAVRLFQRSQGLSVTGIVDELTYNAIKERYASKQAPAPAPAPAPTPEPTPAPAPTNPEKVAGLTAQEQQMINLVNQERVKAGVAPLKVDMRLVQSARAKSKDMIDNNYFSHTSPVYGGFAALIRQYAPDYRYLAENIAGNRSTEAAHQAFMNSEGHKKNILNPNYTHIGIGIVAGGPYGNMFTQHFGG